MKRMLKNRVSIVTGANQGLGFEIAKKYLESGSSLTICARNDGLLEKARFELHQSVCAGQELLALTADFSRPEEVREHHIDVNAIAPGTLNTRMLDEVLEAGSQKVGQAFYDRSLKQKQAGGASLGKGAELAVFLGSSLSDSITGNLISAAWDPWVSFPEHLDELNKTDIYALRRIVPKDRGMTWGNDQ